ncbi:redoxin domain-containing protein [Novipirellula aureliae]|nr:redoxin domain-containing protein [Novipirellula aureliae]
MLTLSAADDVATMPDDNETAATKFVAPDDVLEVLEPLFSSIEQADASRATVKVLTESVSGGQIVDSQESTYQIASRSPDRFTIYLKEPNQRTRIYGNEKEMIVRLAPEAFYKIDQPVGLREAVVALPLPMGPYPEPVLALTLASVDPSNTFLNGMKSIEIVDRDKFRGVTPAVHLKGEQDDAVTWDFWITQDNPPKPLRLLIDLTPMLRSTGELRVPQGYEYQIRFDFLSWRISGEVPDSLFRFQPSEESVEYESLEDYAQAIAGAVNEHPMLGEKAPDFEATTLNGKTMTLDDLKDKVVVIDFWATWCVPCVAALPIIQKVSEDYQDKDVVFLPLNVDETEGKVKEFIAQQQWDIDPIMDAGGKISESYKANAIPQTVVIGKNGVIESVHLGFAGEEELTKRLRDELDVLSVGGRIASSE